MGTKRKTYIRPPPSRNFEMKVVALLLSLSSWLCFFGGKKKWGNWKLKLGKKGRKGFWGDSEAEEDSTSFWVVISLCSSRDDNGEGSGIWCLNCYVLLCNFLFLTTHMLFYCLICAELMIMLFNWFVDGVDHVVVDSCWFYFFFPMNVDEYELKMMKISKVEDEERKKKISCCWYTASYNRHA